MLCTGVIAHFHTLSSIPIAMLNPVPLPSIETTAVKIAGKAMGKGVAVAPSFAGDLAATLAAMVEGVPFPASPAPQPAAQTVPASASSLAAHSMPEPNIILPAPPQPASPNLVQQKAGKAEPSPTPSPVPLSNGSTDPNNGPPNAFPTGNELIGLAEAPLSSNSNPAIGQEASIENTNSPKKADKKANDPAHGSKKADLPLPPDTGMPLSNTPPAAVPLPVVVTIAPTSSTPQLAQNVTPETETGREVAPTLTSLAAPTPTPTPRPQANSPAEPVNLGDNGAGLMPRDMTSGPSYTEQATGAVHWTIDDGANTGQPIPIVASDPPALRKGALSSNAIKLAEKSRSATEKSTQGKSLAVPFQRSDGPDFVNPSQFVASTGPTPTAPLGPSSLAPPLPPSPNNDQHTLNLSAGPVPYGMLPMEIGLGALQGQRALEVRLSPEDLGTVEIRLEVSDDSKVKAKITADRPETLAMMIGDASLIRNALDQSGLTTNADSLQFSLKQDNTAAGNGNGNGNGNGAQQQQNGHSQSQSRNGSPPPPFQESIPLTTLRRAAGLLDVNI